MEARSLASLNLLASNPPQYPVNPSEEPQEPLTLYISRVPGTRDVILSPFKPQVKNVTAEDVASSLYYIHMEKAQLNADLLNPQAIREDEFRSSSEDSAGARAIPRKPVTSLSRKPLPDNARPITPEEPPKPPSHLRVPRDGQSNLRQHGLSVGSYDAPPPPTPPKPMHDSGVGLSDPQPLSAEPYSAYAPDAYMARPPPPKVLGPRPMLNPPAAFAASSPEKRLPELPPEQEPVDRRQAVRRSWGMGPPPGDRSSRSPSPRVYGGTPSPRTAPFTLTLIRRDPSSGNQWNVGKISSHEIEASPSRYDENGARVHAPSSAARPPIEIMIETGGYAKFRNMPVGPGLDLSRGHALGGLPGRSAEDLNHPSRNDQGYFTRQVAMTYSKSWTSSLMEKMSKKAHSRNTSKASVNSVSSAFSAGSDPAGEPGMKPRGYVFTSPWDGRCEFRTGNGGRSVRCHHILHEAPSYNPLVADQEGHATSKPASTTVSELRFNLPGSELFGSGDPDRETKSQWRGHFSKLMGTDDDDDDVVSPFDVNVGAERAGGGNRGKRAKLGKLIIYNDGLKMLDLVVAANVGVWWGAWEKSF